MADLLSRYVLPCQSQVRQNLGTGFFRGQQVVACAAVLRDLPAVAGGMRIVMAAEAARKISMADVVRIKAPVYLHIRKDVAIVNGEHGQAGTCDLGFVLDGSGGILCFVELLPFGRNA